MAVADTSYDEIVLVLEGQAKGGVPKGRDAHLRTVHATRDGDSAITDEARRLARAGRGRRRVTADRGLQQRVEALGCRTMSPSWLLDLLDA